MYATVDQDADVSRDDSRGDESRENGSHGHPDDALYLGEYATLRTTSAFAFQGPRIPGMGSVSNFLSRIVYF